MLVAGLALSSSIGGGEPNSKSALNVLLGQPFGRVWLGVITIGLLGFIAWRFAQSLANSDGHPATLKGYGIRVALLISAVTYSRLAIYAASLALAFDKQKRF